VTTQPTPETLTELKINDALKQKVMQAYVPNDWPIMVAYVDEQGRPGMSYRGSVVVVSETQIGVWARNAEGGTVSALAKNPNVTLVYREPTPDHGRSVAVVTFRGKGRVDNSDAMRDAVYDTMPQRERDSDAEKKGVAIIVDLESVMGFIPGYRLQMVK
jgi:Pyridoxamine 5'-phosphate oxidase